jgi:hypothetical protein
MFILNKSVDIYVYLEQYIEYKVFEINKGDENDA